MGGANGTTGRGNAVFVGSSHADLAVAEDAAQEGVAVTLQQALDPACDRRCRRPGQGCASRPLPALQQGREVEAFRSRILEPADRRDAPGAAVGDLAGVPGVDAAEGEDRKTRGHRLREPVEAAGRDQARLRRRLEDRAEESEVGPLVAGEADFVGSVRRSAEEECSAGAGAPSASRRRASGRPEAGRWTPSAPAARAMSRRALTSRTRGPPAAARASRASSSSSRSARPLRRTWSPSTPAAPSSLHQRRHCGPGVAAGLLMASRRGIFNRVAGSWRIRRMAAQEEIEVVHAPD